MKRDIADRRGIDMMFHVYTRNVKAAATRALLDYGFLGVEAKSFGFPVNSHELREFMEQPDRPKLFPVFSGGSDKTVFDDPMVNWLFRAWHDIGHYVLNQPFTVDGERAVAEWQAEQLSGIDKDILRSDVNDQMDYWMQNHQFVNDQRAFVIDKVFNHESETEIA